VAKRKQVIVGSGTAAVSALRQLRAAGCDDEVVVLTMEKHAPYSPMSLPYVLLGKVGPQDIGMVTDDFFDRMAATFVRERKVISVEPAAHRISYGDGKSERYDRLLIATGSDPIVPLKLKAAGALGFHVMDDCIALESELTGTRRVAIVGAGLVAMELAAALSERGHEVIVIAPRERILRSAFDEEAGGRIIDLFTASGVRVNMKWGEAAEAERRGAGARVRFSGGNEIEADVLLACLGVKPRTALVERSGIEVDVGITVDRRMRTTVPDVFAAGDCVEAADFLTGKRAVNPILPSAADQGKVAGANMAGKNSAYEGSLPMNAFNFFDHLALSIGKVAAGGDEVLIDRRNGSYARLVFTGDALAGASFLDADVDAGVIRNLIRKKIPVGKYREDLLRSPREVGYWLMNEAEKRQTVSKEE